MKKYILDTAALFYLGVVEPDLAYTTQENVDEVLVEHERALVLSYIRQGRLLIVEPDERHMRRASEVAEPGLSSADLKVLALAIQLNERERIPVVTDDYRLQNALSRLSIPFLPLRTRGIKVTYRTVYRCRWCGAYYETALKECPRCGGPLRAVRVPVRGGLGSKPS